MAARYVKGLLRRQMDARLPSREVRAYEAWIKERQTARGSVYTEAPAAGLFSILTPVWDGSPIRYLRRLAQSIAGQNAAGECEWVVLDNGCSNEALAAYLRELSTLPWVNLQRVDRNVGITRGLRTCLEHAHGRYVLPVDGDDLLYPDALRVVALAVVNAGYPPLLYTDEDKVIGRRHYQPYLKPDWDPVLLLNSAYTAHLGVIDREKALQLGAYDDERAEGSPDWDLFVKFLIAGYAAVHIREIVYSWRVHPSSTADDAATKPYIASSQQQVLQRFLNSQPEGTLFEVEPSPLLVGGAHWHFRRRQENAGVFETISIEASTYNSDPRELLGLARRVASEHGFVCFVGQDVEIELPDWQWEAVGITQLHPETVMVGGRLRNHKGVILEAGLEFGINGVCDSPNRGRAAKDPGYFGQTWKQRSVDAVSTQFAVVEASFLVELLEQLGGGTSLRFLGAWAGAYARKTGRRVVYTPFLSGISDVDWQGLVDPSEKRRFEDSNRGALNLEFRDNP